MRVAIIADLHGNLPALDAVLTDLTHEHVDQLICLGDVVEGGPQPCETLARLRELGCPCVLGNTDERMLADRRDEPRSPDLPPADAQELWCANQLTDADRAVLRSFPPTLTVTLDGVTLLGCHGSPRANTDRIDATTTDAALDAWLAGVQADLVVSGHTHLPLVRRHRSRLLVNPGSVGLPYEPGHPAGTPYRPPWAEYAVLAVDGGRVAVDVRRTPVDIHRLRDVVVQSGMPRAAAWLAAWRASDQ